MTFVQLSLSLGQKARSIVGTLRTGPMQSNKLSMEHGWILGLNKKFQIRHGIKTVS